MTLIEWILNKGLYSNLPFLDTPLAFCSVCVGPRRYEGFNPPHSSSRCHCCTRAASTILQEVPVIFPDPQRVSHCWAGLPSQAVPTTLQEDLIDVTPDPKRAAHCQDDRSSQSAPNSLQEDMVDNFPVSQKPAQHPQLSGRPNYVPVTSCGKVAVDTTRLQPCFWDPLPLPCR